MNYRFHNYLLHEESRELLRNGERVTMTAKSFAVLLEVVKAQGKVVSKQELMEAVWSDSHVDGGSVAQNIFVLRKLLAADFPDTQVIETVARLGYRFRLPVTEEADTHPASNHAPPSITEIRDELGVDSQPPQHTVASLPSGRGFLTAAMLVPILLIAITAWAFHRRNAVQRRDSGTIAVLALRNLTGSTDNAWLSLALREMLSTNLTTGTGLKLLPEQTVKHAQEELGLENADGLSPETLHRLQGDLDCDKVISGSYAVSGGRIQMDLHLMDASTGAQLASYSVNRPEVELQALVEEGGRSLRNKFGVAPPSQDDRMEIEATLPTSVEAYRLYVDGVQAGREYNSLQARESLTKSIAIDPNFALSHAALASAYQLAGLQTKANEEADRALSLSGNLSQVDRLNVQVDVQGVHHQYQAAAETYRTLMGISPYDLGYGVLYAQALNNAGHSHEALQELDKLMARPGPEATDPRLYSTAADAWGVLGDWQRSLEWAQRAAAESKRRGARISYGRILTSVSQAHMYLKQYEPAIAETNESLAIAREFKDYSAELRALNRLAQIDLAQNKLDHAHATLLQALNREQQIGEQQRQIHTLVTLGKVLTQEGDHPQALSYYNRAVDAATSFGQAEFLVNARYYQALGRKNTGDLAGAERQLVAVVDDAGRIDDKQTRMDALHAMAQIQVEQGRERAALTNIHAALQLTDTHTSHGTRFSLLDLQTRALFHHGELSAAQNSLHQEQTLLASVPDEGNAQKLQQTQSMLQRGSDPLR